MKPGGITSLVCMVGFSQVSFAMIISGVHASTASQNASFLAGRPCKFAERILRGLVLDLHVLGLIGDDLSWGEPGEPICVSPGMLEVVELLLSESSQLSEEKLLMLVSMCESKRAAEWLGVSQLAHIHVTFVWFNASYVSEFIRMQSV